MSLQADTKQALAVHTAWTVLIHGLDATRRGAGKIAYDCREKGRAPTVLTIGAPSINIALKVRRPRAHAAVRLGRDENVICLLEEEVLRS